MVPTGVSGDGMVAAIGIAPVTSTSEGRELIATPESPLKALVDNSANITQAATVFTRSPSCCRWQMLRSIGDFR
jgi:hypothetical protein